MCSTNPASGRSPGPEPCASRAAQVGDVPAGGHDYFADRRPELYGQISQLVE